MKFLKTCTAPLLVLLSLAPASASERQPLNWAALPDAQAQIYEDPFRDLSTRHLSALATYVRLKARLETTKVPDKDRPGLEARLSQKQRTLEEAGVNIKELLAERDAVTQRRRAAATATNPALDGARIRIGGYLIPVPTTENGKHIAYLVPERGMCSHTPAPPPNQLIRLELEQPIENASLYAPTGLLGTLHAREIKQEAYIVDGQVTLWSAWTMIVASAKTVPPEIASRQTKPSQSADAESRTFVRPKIR